MPVGARLRMTRQRQVILEEIREARRHPTADEVFARVRRRLPRISLGTVYRTLDLLSESGLIRRLEFGGSQRRFDGRIEEHHHIRCLGCGRLDDVDPASLDLGRVPARLDGYLVIGLRLELIGLCAACQAEKAGSVHPGRRRQASGG